jgi:predicted dienelactone hydrolase
MQFRFTLLAVLCLSPAAYATTPLSQADLRADYPELSRRGPNPVGFRQVEVVDPHRIDFLHSDPASGKVALGDRHLFVTIWYPAASGDPNTVAHYDRHPGAGPGTPYAASAQFPQTGFAIADAAPQKGAAPLVIVSHGFTNWAAYTAQLAEILASRGYVVAAIDHDDIPGKNMGLAFADTSSGRSRDQRAVALQLRAWANDSSFPLSGVYDPDKLALVGYSMGGFGVLESAGAGFDSKGAFFGMMPKATFEGMLDDQAKPIQGLKALVLLAPWGGQPGNRAWSAEALATIKAPALVIDGDHDDIAGYKEGVHWIYDNLKSSDRYLLVFENARHNIVGADAPASALDSFATIEKWDEPVWRKDRIRAIDAHFIVAFLDRVIRNDASMDGYLNPPTPHSSDGTWPPSRGQDAGSEFAGHDPSSANYWKGFQRRWALGLELQHDKP